MESILIGFILLGIIGYGDRDRDTFEIGKVYFTENEMAETPEWNDRFEKVEGNSLGSRDFFQLSNHFRVGYASYLFHLSEKENATNDELSQFGGYAGVMLEYNLESFFSLGAVIGGGTSVTEFKSETESNEKEQNYFGLASPYVTVGFPISQGVDLLLTASGYVLSEPAETIDGQGTGYEPPKLLGHKIGLEIVW